MKFQITDIEFDLTDDCGEYIDTEMLQNQLQKAYTKTSWDADDHDDLLEQISNKSGWCINSIEYDETKSMIQLDAYTNCAFIQLGDIVGIPTNFRKCKILTWDGDNCDVIVYSDWSDNSKGLVTSILSKDLYKTIYPFPVDFFTDDEFQTVTKMI